MPHGAPSDYEKHVGDLGNIDANSDGESIIFKSGNERLTGDPEFSIAGRSIVIHENEDDLVTSPSGNAGARLKCCIIVMDTVLPSQ